jgi:tellurite methyltransferase
MRSPWAREYVRTPTRYVWGTAPSRLAVDVARRLPARARVLDLGCGEGRDSVYFAARGHLVTGVDLSRAGLRKAERLARARGVAARWVGGDLARVPARGRFDLVHSCGAIHYVPRRRRASLFGRLHRMTRPGGLHALIVFTDRLVYVEKGEVIDYFGPGELAGFYREWGVLHHAERLIACAQDGRPHHHSVEELIARAPRAGDVVGRS